MPRCLVTGGGGFIGSHLVEALLLQGHQVRVLDDFSTGNVANLAKVRERVDILVGSIADPAVVAQAVWGCEVVYHLAALPSVVQSVADPLRSHDYCATGTVLVLDAARRLGVRRVVYAASSSAYGNSGRDIQREDDPVAPLSPYGVAKLAGEFYCRCFTEVYGLETVCLRFFNVFGPRQDPRSPYSGVIALFISALNGDRVPTIYGDGLQTRDFVYVANVVQALTKAAVAPAAPGQVFNIGTGRGTTILDLVHNLNQLLGKKIKPVHAPARAGDVRHSLADISKAQRDLGYDPNISLVEGLKRTLEAT